MTTVAPPVTLDPRFRAGRTLVQTGRAGEGAIDIFETLVQESRREFGESSVQAAACYFEYGNALFRAAARRGEQEEDQQQQQQEEEEEEDTKPPAAASLEDEQEETGQDSKPESRNDSKEAIDENDEERNPVDDDIDDVELALEMMETAWSILDQYVSEENNNDPNYTEWASNQLPRILLGIGDVLSSLNRHADAADAYSRALPHREAALQKFKNDDLELEHLKRRRQLVEANVLVAEALLACPKDQDVVTTETNDLLVKASERVEYARGYYDKARDELQETVFLMGKIAASGKDLGTEKEDVCFISTLLMAVGTTLAELDEEQAEQQANGDSKPPAKKQKT